MKQEYDNELTQDQREKMKKNLVYLGCFSVAMLFAGLTSGYIVSMGGSFWVKYDFPTPFYISTVLIVLSSILLQVGISMARKGRPAATKILVPLTFLLGLGFAWYQFKGYGALIDKGVHFRSNILVTEGRYGEYFELKVNGKYLEINANDYLVGGKKMSPAEKEGVSAYASQFLTADTILPSAIKNTDKYTLLYNHEEVTLKNGKLYAADTLELLFTDLRRLRDFSRNLADGRGDFFIKGEMGKDFHIYYQGREVEYKDRTLYYKGRKFSPFLQTKIAAAADTATSYLYIITLVHVLHILGALIYMLLASIRSFSGSLAQNDYIGIRTGAIFWHFLGALWIYLLLFLLFIH